MWLDSTGRFVVSRSHKKASLVAPLRPVDPSLRCNLIVVRVAARQQHAAIVELSFSHEVPCMVHLADHHKKFPACRIEHLDILASACDWQLSGRQRYCLFRELEAAVVEGRSCSESSGFGIVDFRAAHGSVPVALVGAAHDEHAPVGKQARCVFATRGNQASSFAECSSVRVVELCASE